MSKWTIKEKTSIALFIVGILMGLPAVFWYVWVNIIAPDSVSTTGSWLGYLFGASTIILTLASLLSGIGMLKLLRKHKKPS